MCGRALPVLGAEEVRVVRLVPDRPQLHGRVAQRDGAHPAAEQRRVRVVDVVLLPLRGPLRHGPGEREMERHPAPLRGGDELVERGPRAGGVGVGVRGVEARRVARPRLGRELAPVDERADLVDAEPLDLVERRLARGRVDQLGGRLEGHHLGAGRRRGRRRAEGGSGEHEAHEGERAQHVHGISTPAAPGGCAHPAASATTPASVTATPAFCARESRSCSTTRASTTVTAG